MQEVLPSIEKCWVQTASKIKAESQIINVDVTPLRSFINYLFHCDVIVIIAFNETISRFMIEVRKTMGLTIPFVLHLYGHASLGLWPQQRFGVLSIMNAGDAFIGTCPGDLKCMLITGENLLTYDVPYPYFPIIMEKSETEIKELKFAYIGRISDQKNIDILIDAYYLLSLEIEDLPKFFIYGQEDHFGSPNMGIISSKCLNNLNNKISQLNLQKNIFFKGFKERSEIYSELGKKHIFLSASTHSDENFGMALLRSLSFGAMAVITQWGGHIHFIRQCSNKVWGVPVEFNNIKPSPNVMVFKEQLKNALLASFEYFKNEDKEPIPDYFLPNNVVKQFSEILEKISFNEESLEISKNAKMMYKQQQEYEEQGDLQRVFRSYADPLAQLYLKAYQE